MSHGVANVLTLYDQDGHPVEVELRDGKYVLATESRAVEKLLSEILEKLGQIYDVLDT